MASGYLNVSIIVTSNSTERKADILDLLRSIKEQEVSNYELIYVTEGKGRLFQFVQDETSRLGLNARVIRNEGSPGLSEARNAGSRGAVGEILGFVDDDVVLDRGWSRAVEELFQKYPSAVGASGPAYPLWVGEPAEWLPKELDWLIGCTRWFKPSGFVEVRNCWGMNMAFRTRQFRQIGGFSVDSGYHRGRIAEDIELSLRIRGKTGGKILYSPKMLVKSKVHPYRLSNKFIIERSRWIGYSRRSIRDTASTNGLAHQGIERSVLSGILTSVILPDSSAHSLSAILRKYKTLALCAFSLALGYLNGPILPNEQASYSWPKAT